MDLLQLFQLAAADCGTTHGALPSLYDGLCKTSNEVQITSVTDFARIIGNLVRILTAVSGALAVIAILAAAIYYITSTGDPARVNRAKDILVSTVTGLVLIIVAYAVVTFISGNF